MHNQSVKLKKRGDAIQCWNEMHRDFFKYVIDQVPEGQEMWLTIATSEPTRTQAQNRFYWKYLTTIADDTGDDKEALHEYFKEMFLTPKLKMFRGKEIKIYPTTTQLTIKQFMTYIKEIERESEIPAPSTELNGLDKYITSGIL